MVEVRACLYFSVIILCFHVIVGKPIFGDLWCDFACDDDDDVSTSTTTSTEDYDFMCAGCPPRRRRTTTPRPMITAMQPQGPVNLMIPPSNGMNVSLNNMGGSWLMSFVPWLAPAATATTPGGAAGGATTAAPATTAAAGAATTAAAGAATTAAATTAAPAG